MSLSSHLRCGALAFFAISIALSPGLIRSASAAGATADAAPIERYPVGGAGGWDFLTLDPTGDRLFIARGDRVHVWSTRSRKVVAEITGTSGVHGIALAPELNRGFTSNGRSTP
jgi:hypothetical protein